MIAAIVVTYQPDHESFGALLTRLAPQVQLVCIVDNSPKQCDEVVVLLRASGIDLDAVRMVRLGDNLGIATAINVGIRIVFAEHADFVLLCDHDSLPAPDMVSQLHAAYIDLSSRKFPVGAVGPTFTDHYTGITYPFQTHSEGHYFYRHQAPTAEVPHISALTLITSGTLIPAKVLLDVGPMRDDFFIDQVDIEWCHRARAKGYVLFGTLWAKMFQRMGQARLRIWWLRWRNESTYPPTRLYYRLRNFVALCRLDSVDWSWKLRSAWYWLGIVYAHVVFSKDRFGSAAMALKGIWHGIRGTMGPYPSSERGGR